MDKELKEKIKNARSGDVFPSIYDQKTIEQAADEGYQRMLLALKDATPESSHPALETDIMKSILTICYYSCFEDAYHTFLELQLKDICTELEITINEFHETIAKLKPKKQDHE